MSDNPNNGLNNDEVVWTPQMPDRRKADRRGSARDLQTNGKSMRISSQDDNNDRRDSSDRRKKVTVTITGRAMDVEEATTKL